jgi:hypothetical protein
MLEQVCYRKKFEPIDKELWYFFSFYPKNCYYAFKNMGSGSRIWDPKNIYSGSRIQEARRHRIPDPDPQHCLLILMNRYLLEVPVAQTARMVPSSCSCTPGNRTRAPGVLGFTPSIHNLRLLSFFYY